MSSLPLEVVCRDRDRPTPCVDYHIKQCLAPCIGTVTPQQYRLQAIDGVRAFFQGKYQEVERILTERMQEAASAKKFERAAKLRDQLEQLRRTRERQWVSDTSGADTDTIGVALLSGRASIVLLRERGGKLLSEESFPLQGTAETLADVLGQFLPQYYVSVSDLPDTVVVGEEPRDRETIEQWLGDLRGKRVKLHVPERGKKSKLLLLAEKNADWKAKQAEAKWEAETRKTEGALKELQDLLKLPVLPRRIEGYDVSHLGGTHTVGSMVVFQNGKPKREHYRSFNLYTLKGAAIDDYKALAEALRRRLRHLGGGLKQELKQWKEKGIVIRRARKADWPGIEAVIEASPRDLTSDDLREGEFVVAARGKNIVGCCRLFEHPTGLLELRSVCIAKAEQGQRLGQSVIRAALAGQKQKKVYIIIDPDLEQYYAEIRFRHVLKVPPILERKIARLLVEAPHLGPLMMVMVYDPSQHKADVSFQTKPDLLLIDGGRGQLSAAERVLAEFRLSIPALGLAKREEEIFVPPPPPTPPPSGEGSKKPNVERTYSPLKVPQDSAARFLLQRLRDEAHRFANAKREGRQKASTFRSKLDEIPCIGGIAKEALLRQFGSVEAVFAATDAELGEILTGRQIEEIRRRTRNDKNG